MRNMRERVDKKYMAEEKDVEDEEANSKRTVAERRIEIEKRLSAERQIPASTQKSEIVQEITDIKRHSVVEDTISKHEDVILSQKLDQKLDHITAAPIKTTVTTVTTRVTESNKTDPLDKKIEIIKSTVKTGAPTPLDKDLEAKLAAQKEKIDTSAKRAEQILVTTTIKEIHTDGKTPKIETMTATKIIG